MKILTERRIQVLGMAWLAIVAVQYLGRYYLPWLNRLDLSPAYIIMMTLAVVVLILHYRRIRME